MTQASNFSQSNGFKTETNAKDSEGWMLTVAQSGEAIGKGISAIARELGVAITEFMNTPVGTAAIAMLIWYLFGSDVVHLLAGFFFLSVGNYICYKYVFRAFADKIQTTEKVYKNFLGKEQTKTLTVWSIDKESDGRLFSFCAFVLANNASGVMFLVFM